MYDPATQKPIENLFVDLDGDGLITDRDRYRYKNPDATYLFGFSPTVNYKKWTGGFVARASVGNYVYNNNASSRGTKNSILNPLGFLANGSRSVLETGFVGAGNRFYSSDYYVENASFLRMDNVSLTYNAGKLIRSSNAGFRFNFNVQNVFVSTKYKGIDAMFVAIHQYQLSTFFFVISHIPVKAVAEANASAHGIAPGAKSFFR